MNSNKKDLLDVFTSDSLTYQQKLYTIANVAERYFDARDVLGLTNEEYGYIENDYICDLNEGNLPYRPRYIVPDYEVLLKNGVKFLELDAPTDLDEVLDYLLILYSHVPSVTSFPVFIGYLDRLINPFLTGDDAADQKKIKRFLNHIDKTVTDSFCHADLGPVCNKATTLILNAVLELDNPTPNMSFLYNKGISDEETYTLAIKAGLLKSKPSIANDKYYASENDRYAIVSCYNCLPEQGGAFTLTRLRLGTIASDFDNLDDFLQELDKIVTANLSIIDKKIDFIVNKSNFFKTSFLEAEGFISKDRFVGMLGIVGLFECVNHFVKAKTMQEQFGFSEEADKLAHKILSFIESRIKSHYAPYSMGNKYWFHAQVGASLSDEDYNNTPAHRLKVNQEPMIYDHIKQIAPFHKYFPSGVGDLFAFDQTFSSKPEALKPIIDAAFKYGMRYISVYQENTDLIRVTGYLVKKSEVSKFEEGTPVLRDTEAFGEGTNRCANVFARKVKF
ncbi:YjjI family glycine radical enzyme [Mycoplasma sp. P36-A1]|uniref:YjjI family glycine radical enzyme n=1 Tax=Mycoplasma sp. P36-A1 TaxID=3252900 RepID=UPI003C3020B2